MLAIVLPGQGGVAIVSLWRGPTQDCSWLWVGALTSAFVVVTGQWPRSSKPPAQPWSSDAATSICGSPTAWLGLLFVSVSCREPVFALHCPYSDLFCLARVRLCGTRVRFRRELAARMPLVADQRRLVSRRSREKRCEVVCST